MNRLIEAIENDNLVAIKKLCNDDIDLTTPIDMGAEYGLDETDETTILFYTIRKYGSIEALEILLEHGVDIREIDPDGLSALDVAIKFKREDVIKLCIDKGIDINETHRQSGITPIILASCFNNTSIVELLLSHGADINAQDSGGMSAKDYAKKLGQKKMLEFLEERGAKHNLYQESQSTATPTIEKSDMRNRKAPTDEQGFDSI
ncbi:MAG: ankyrin repeat domain-containing protein [Sulfurovum sp.]|nr:MAG: ankyrin repeat domain-containing protein [Sulfurovum sp.]